MAADSIIYCLDNLTDYRQFERLCSDMMSQAGYQPCYFRISKPNALGDLVCWAEAKFIGRYKTL